MKKLLLMFVALFVMGGGTIFAAEDIVINFATDTQTWWGAAYDSDTQSMICTTGGEGLSWFWWDGRSTADYEEFQIVVNSEVDGTLQVIVQYLDDGDDNPHSNREVYSVTAGEETTLTCPIEKEMEAFQQIALQGGEEFVGTVKLISAVVKAVPDEDRSGNDYDELPIDEDGDLGSGWSSSYNGATHTITYESAWSGRGWWFGNPDGKDCTAYEGVEVVLKTELTGSISLTAQYNYFDEGSDEGLTTSASITGSGSSVEQTIYCAFDETMKDNVMQIWIQSAQAGDIVLVSAKLIKPASEGGDEVTAYFDSSSVDWDPVYCFIFGGSEPWPTITAEWPGDLCELVDDNVWKWTYTGSEEVTDWMIIFCNEDGSSQTDPDFVFYNGGLYNSDGYVGEYTGITSVVSETTSAKVTGIYNLAGQRVNENTKGILIKDGKKVLVK